MKVAIFGAGSLGTVLGAYIARNNEQIDLINHNKEHIEALKTFGARIVGRVEFNQKVNALTVEEMDDNYDIIYLLTKQLDNENVVKMLKNHLNKDGVICTMQNGLPEKLISSIFSATLSTTEAKDFTFLCSSKKSRIVFTVIQGNLNTAPILPRTTLGEYMSQQSLDNITPSIPTASAVLKIVPKFEGSCIPSRAKTLPLSFIVSNRDFLSRVFIRQSTPWGVFVSDIELNTDSFTR